RGGPGLTVAERPVPHLSPISRRAFARIARTRDLQGSGPSGARRAAEGVTVSGAGERRPIDRGRTGDVVLSKPIRPRSQPAVGSRTGAFLRREPLRLATDRHDTADALQTQDGRMLGNHRARLRPTAAGTRYRMHSWPGGAAGAAS